LSQGQGQDVIVRVFIGAVGQTPNDQVKFCRICKARGWPHEAISFRKINGGRLKGEDQREFTTYQILNYADDSPHECRPPRNTSNERSVAL